MSINTFWVLLNNKHVYVDIKSTLYHKSIIKEVQSVRFCSVQSLRTCRHPASFFPQNSRPTFKTSKYPGHMFALLTSGPCLPPLFVCIALLTHTHTPSPPPPCGSLLLYGNTAHPAALWVFLLNKPNRPICLSVCPPAVLHHRYTPTAADMYDSTRTHARTHTHACTHTRTHAQIRARTHTRTRWTFAAESLWKQKILSTSTLFFKEAVSCNVFLLEAKMKLCYFFFLLLWCRCCSS